MMISNEQFSKPYRDNVGMVVFNRTGNVLVGERVEFDGFWQFPQGGVDPKENLIEAVFRELKEEVGIENPKIVTEIPDWIYYDFPIDLKLHSELKKFRGQKQKWFLLFWNGEASECNLISHEQEFSRVQFMPIRDTIKLIVPFKVEVYKKVIEYFEPKIKTYLLEKF